MRAILLFIFIFAPSSVWAGCSTSDIAIKSIRAKWIDQCKRTPCIFMKGAAVLTNKCTSPVGVQVKITGLDKEGRPVASKDMWPASIRNIPPGDYMFSLDTWLAYDSDIVSFEASPISVKRW